MIKYSLNWATLLLFSTSIKISNSLNKMSKCNIDKVKNGLKIAS